MLTSAITTVVSGPFSKVLPPWPDKELFTQNVTNVTFILKPLQIQNIKKKCGETWYIISPPSEKSEGHGRRIPHLNAPMGAGGLRGQSNPKIFSPPLEKSVGHSLKIWTLPDISGVPSWLRAWF